MAKWFGPKETSDMGVRSWQGWVAVAVLLVCVFGARIIPYVDYGLPDWSRHVASLAVVLIFLPVVYMKYGDD